jgi:hypothetical protein
MAIKAYTLAITIAVVGPLTVAITGGSLAAPALSGASVLKAAVPIAATGRKVPKGRAAILELFRRLGLPTYRQGYDPSDGSAGSTLSFRSVVPYNAHLLDRYNSSRHQLIEER